VSEKWPLFYEDIREEFLSLPESLEKCIENYFYKEGKELIHHIQEILSKLQFSHVIFIGNTFNFFASEIPKYLLMNDNESVSFTWQNVEVTEFYDYFLPKERDLSTLYIFISKSGKSRLLKKIIEQLHILNIDPNLIWLVTNNIKSPISSYCGVILPIYVDSEIVLSSKSFPHTIVVLYFISQILLGKDPISKDIHNKIMNFISELKEYRKIEPVQTKALVNFLGEDFKIVYLISRDPVSEASSKLLALNANSFIGSMCEGISLGLFFHGPFQIFERKQINSKIKCVLIGAFEQGETEKETLPRLIELILQRAGSMAIICNNSQLIKKFQDEPKISVVNFESYFTPLAPIFQSFILSTALLRISLNKGLIRLHKKK
jgi:glucosamine 6-phosphate synthetase-like amidotransferase/phosphosugar isomerase protein